MLNGGNAYVYSGNLSDERFLFWQNPRLRALLWKNQVVITPRNYGFDLRSGGQITSHYAMIGMACVMEDYPLYYDAVNEKGLGIAGLNFVGNAYYHPPMGGKGEHHAI